MVMGREETPWTKVFDWKATGPPAEEDSLEWTDTGLGDRTPSLALGVSTSLGFSRPHCLSSVREARLARWFQPSASKTPLRPAGLADCCLRHTASRQTAT